MKAKVLLTLITITLIGLFCRKDTYIQETPKSIIDTTSYKTSSDISYKEGEVLIEFTDGVNLALLKDVSGKIRKKIHTKAMEHFNKKEFYIIEVKDVLKSIDHFKNNPYVKWASPNYKLEAVQSYPNDPYYTSNQLWGMTNIKANQAWQYNKGSQQVYIGIIDEGIMHWHEDLCGQIWENPFDPVDGVDNDGNGYIDDKNGWDFLNEDNSIYDGTDDHGTHVAGTIGGKGNNSKGVIGVSPYVTIISGKFLENSGYTSDAVEAIDYMIDLKVRHGLNIVATSNSWGGGGYSQALYDAVERSKNANMLFICAAGNNGRDIDASPSYPASMDNENIISVAATTSAGAIASYSNYGATSVDIGAPGSGIYSTIPSSTSTSSYASYNGTSMATPHVAGAVALYAATNPTATWSQIKNAILNNARPLSSLNGKTVTGGTLDLGFLTTTVTENYQERGCTPDPVDLTPPSPPQNFRLTDIIDGYAYVAWDPAIDNESGIAQYYVTEYWPNGDQWGPGIYSSSTFTARFVVADGLSYKFVAKARNKYGLLSGPTDTLYVTAPGIADTEPPSLPQNLRYVTSTETSISYAWDASTDNVGVYRYLIEWGPVGGLGSTGTTVFYPAVTVINLSPGVTYRFRVQAQDRALNSSGWTDYLIAGTTGADMTAPSTPVMNQPSNVSQYSALFTWSAATDNVGVTGYDFYYKSSSATVFTKVSLGNVLQYTPSLSPSTTYTAYVVARDGAGNVSNSSNSVNVTTQALSQLSANLDGTSNLLNVSLNWTIQTDGTIAQVQLQRKKNAGGTYSGIYDPSPSTSGSYNDRVNGPGTYYYRVYVRLTNGQAVYSNEKVFNLKKR